jgi:hypothetical protein
MANYNPSTGAFEIHDDDEPEEGSIEQPQMTDAELAQWLMDTADNPLVVLAEFARLMVENDK